MLSGITVNPSEAEALQAYRAQQPVDEQACLSLLRRAARDKSVAAELVEGAIVHLEQIHKPGEFNDIADHCHVVSLPMVAMLRVFTCTPAGWRQSWTSSTSP